VSWVQAIFDFIRQFFPFEIVWSYQRGIRFWLGVDRKELPPGLYMFLPFFGHIETVNVMPDVMKLWKFTPTTKDGVALTVSANIRYEITDARAAFCAVQDYKDNLGDECRTHLAARIRDCTYQELLEDQKKIERLSKDTMTTAVKDYGVRILRVGIVDFVKTKNLSLTQT
jgi:regulator of protease activity HflC (stomatin/prohibitin superfamily)